jgi:hypothetical protein
MEHFQTQYLPLVAFNVPLILSRSFQLASMLIAYRLFIRWNLLKSKVITRTYSEGLKFSQIIIGL